MTVLISGIGIAGPTLAYWLCAHGLECTLVEQAPRLRQGGYIMDFWGSGFDVAERMGLLPEIRRVGYNAKELRIVNARGRRIAGFDVEVFRTAANGRFVSITRGDLAAILYRAIEGRCETIFGDSIREITQQRDAVEVAFERGPARWFDLVIGADGLHSVVRRLAFGDDRRFEKFLGYSAAAFEASGYLPRDEDIYVSYSVPGRQAARFALRDDRTLFFFFFADEGAGRNGPCESAARKEILRTQFGTLGWECPQMLAALDSCRELYFDRVSQIRMDGWARGRVGLIGDAAACPSLLSGQGSALGMLAAYVLAGELGKTKDAPEEALKRYEQRLREFVLGKQISAEKFAGSFAPKTPLGLFLRNQATKAFAIPFVAKRVMKSTLVDHIELPEYPMNIRAQ